LRDGRSIGATEIQQRIIGFIGHSHRFVEHGGDVRIERHVQTVVDSLLGFIRDPNDVGDRATKYLRQNACYKALDL